MGMVVELVLLGLPAVISILLRAGGFGPLSLLKGRNHQTLLNGNRAMQLGRVTELDLEVLQTDSFVRLPVFINLEKQGKDKFPRKILYPSIMP